MRPTSSLLILAATLAVSTGAQAQPGPRAPSPEMQAMRVAHMQQRAADLRTVLRLRPDQEGAFQAFLKSIGPPPGMHGMSGMSGMHEMSGMSGPPKAISTPERLDEMAKRRDAREAEGQRRVEALKTFYAALNTEQKQVFDALGRLRGGPGMRGHGGRGGKFGGHMGRGDDHGPGRRG